MNSFHGIGPAWTEWQAWSNYCGENMKVRRCLDSNKKGSKECSGEFRKQALETPFPCPSKQ